MAKLSIKPTSQEPELSFCLDINGRNASLRIASSSCLENPPYYWYVLYLTAGKGIKKIGSLTSQLGLLLNDEGELQEEE